MQLQYRLMCLAQSNGLFCDSKLAFEMVKQRPHATAEELLQLIKDRMRPLNIYRPSRDPRTLSSDERLHAAASAADAASSASNLSSLPLSPHHLEEVAPMIVPSEIPETLLQDVKRCEHCVICSCYLISPGDTDELPIRQLACSHAFHAMCAPGSRLDLACPPAPAARVHAHMPPTPPPSVASQLHRPLAHRAGGHMSAVPQGSRAAVGGDRAARRGGGGRDRV